VVTAEPLDEWDRYRARFAADVCLDAFHNAEAAYWRRRADTFEWAKPRLDDFHGQATRQELSEAWRRCDESARACRAKAEFLERSRRGDAA